MPKINLPKMPIQKNPTFVIKGWKGLNTREADLDVEDNELTAGTNVLIDNSGALSKRPGRSVYGAQIGTTTKILGAANFTNLAGTQEQLVVYNTSVYRYVTGTWTALTGATLTTNKPMEFAYYESTNKLYGVNKTDSAVVYTSGSSTATDASFKKGQYIVPFENRLLVANVTNQEDYVWYTDLSVDTFSANNYFRVAGGAITGMCVAPTIKAVLVSTLHGLYRLQNFTFNGIAQGPEAVITISSQIGTCAGRSMVEVNGLVYFLASDSKDLAQIYATDGHSVIPIGDKIRTELSGLTASQLSNASATSDGRFYRLSVCRGTTLDTELVYDTIRKTWQTRWTNGYSCYFTSVTTGRQELFAGDPVKGVVYKLTTTNGYDQVCAANGDVSNQDIAFSAETKALSFDSDMQKKWLYKGYVVTDSGATINVGINNSGSISYLDTVVDISTGATTWGGGGTWGGGKTWGGTGTKPERIFNIDSSVSKGRYFKFKISNTSDDAIKVYRLGVKYRVLRTTN